MRRSKLQGSCKLGFRCTAFITAKTNLKDGTVSIEYCLDHTGHVFHLADQDPSQDHSVNGSIMNSLLVTPGLEVLKEKNSSNENSDAIDDSGDSEMVFSQDIPSPKMQHILEGHNVKTVSSKSLCVDDSEKKSLGVKKHITCPVCNIPLSCKQALLKHKKRKHAHIVLAPEALHEKCIECDDFKASSIVGMIGHLNECHNKDIHILKKLFETHDDFMEWKKETERMSRSSFTTACGSKKSSTFTTSFYRCHRSGKKRLVSKRLRKSKLHGSCKLGFRCTAFITAKTSLKDGTVSIEYCLDHTGHAFNLADQTLSQDS
ncbi:zinc finger protein [Elysia marginata]|uniref:Zinc finger protein n=1 Tax=Elysia marginata TaxID=1093978 RepID=A0AAV4FTW7_9GAST|nr:zinc finger protein [Elysia marginata]